jgi:signal transduction histidine kinase
MAPLSDQQVEIERCPGCGGLWVQPGSLDHASAISAALAGVARSRADRGPELNEELEERVLARTKELHDAQAALMEKERLAAVGQLMSTISHEMRNPLSVLKTSLHVLEHADLPPEPRVSNALQRMQRSVERGDRILDEMLTFAGEKELVLASTRLDPWVTALLQGQQIPARAVLRHEPGAPGAMVCIDRTILSQAVAAVVRNACQAVDDPAGGASESAHPTILVQTRASGDVAEIAIEDTGPGMPDDVLAQAFEPMFSTRGFGAGLGLTRARRIVERHGGSIDVDSTLRQGTRVRLSIPVQRGSVSYD